ncbi:MAG: zinc ribbon domain-containing protein, partial [Anaerolineae bacterium]|nr:zinc ribbon domain-containing protein [Anaerolineae bacterium]
MLYCPKCGTANRRGSRFCNECGELLPMHTGLRCPMCGAMNPVQNAYCDQCNARIVPMSSSEQPESGQPSIRGVSLPAISFGEKPPIPEPLDAASPEGVVGKAEADDRLTQFRETPDESKAETSAEDADDWLSQLRDLSTEPVEEPAGEPLEEGETDSWIAQLRDLTTEEEPTIAHELKTEAEPIEPVEMPDWLQGLAPLGTEGPPAETGAGPALSAFEETAPEMPAPAEVPDWLQDLAPAEPAPAAAERPIPSEAGWAFPEFEAEQAV